MAFAGCRAVDRGGQQMTIHRVHGSKMWGAQLSAPDGEVMWSGTGYGSKKTAQRAVMRVSGRGSPRNVLDEDWRCFMIPED